MNSKLNKLFFSILTIFLFYSFNGFSQQTVNKLIEQKREFNKTAKTTAKYKIQLYNGDEQRAYTVRNNFSAAFPNIHYNISYDAPEWKIQVGSFKTRLEADRTLLLIKEQFSGAIVIEIN